MGAEIDIILKIAEYLIKIPAKVKEKFDADDSTKLANRYYQKGTTDLALILIDNAIAKNKTNEEVYSWLHILKGDLLIEKGMHLYQSDVECAAIFENSIKEFNESIKTNPFNSVAWLGIAFNHAMIGIIYINKNKDLTNGCYHHYQTIFSADAGLASLEEEGQNIEREQNLWAMKGAAYYSIGNDEEGDKCFEKAKINLQPTNVPSNKQ